MSRSAGYARLDLLCPYYTEIAFQHYYEIKERCLFYSQNYSFDIFNEARIILQKSMVTVVFSQMAIESFCNDYAATCLGDNEFYDNFDKLEFMNKLQFVIKFVLQDTWDKREPYTSLKALNKYRNEYIHNKSRMFTPSKIEKDMFDAEDTSFEPDDKFFKNEFNSELKYIKECLRKARIAIKAIVEVVNFFDGRDEGIPTFFNFFAFTTDPIGIKKSDLNKELKSLGLNHEISI